MSEISNDSTPQWGVNILIAIERLDAKISSNDERHSAHGVWAERNIKDLEIRMRAQEQSNDPALPARVTKLEQFRYLIMGAALAGGSIGSMITVAIQKALGA